MQIMDTYEMLKRADCLMEVVCNKKWDQLVATEEEGIKFCGDCKKLVFYTQTPSELLVAAKKGLCVYIAPNSKAKQERDSSETRLRKIEAKALRKLMGPSLGVAIIR